MATSTTADAGEDGIARAAHSTMVELIPSLPLETRCPPYPLRQYGGFWLPEWVLPSVAAVRARFEPRQDDVFLASFPKSGTTWLKALAFAVVSRAEHPPSGEGHPLRLRNPHDCVEFLESSFTLSDSSGGGGDELEALPSPRLLATHIPYSLLPESITSASSGCRIVYICRDPKDTLVSTWLFTKKNMEADAAEADGANNQQPSPYTIEEAFELFCEGRFSGGPQWRHIVEYWEESQRRPEKVLFLRYEDMLREPLHNVRKLAEFMGCPFAGEEDAGGGAHAIVELCSLDNLKSLKVNKDGDTPLAVPNKFFFRKGVAGDWSNHMSSEMGARLDSIVEDALQGSGVNFAPLATSPHVNV